MTERFTCNKCGETHDITKYKRVIEPELGTIRECPNCGAGYQVMWIEEDRIKEVRNLLED